MSLFVCLPCIFILDRPLPSISSLSQCQGLGLRIQDRDAKEYGQRTALLRDGGVQAAHLGPILTALLVALLSPAVGPMEI